MGIEEVTMIQSIEELITREYHQELREFADYLGVDYEDYLEHLHPDVDFDDVSM
jgi:hypothetical protein